MINAIMNSSSSKRLKRDDQTDREDKTNGGNMNKLSVDVVVRIVGFLSASDARVYVCAVEDMEIRGKEILNRRIGMYENALSKYTYVSDDSYGFLYA